MQDIPVYPPQEGLVYDSAFQVLKVGILKSHRKQIKQEQVGQASDQLQYLATAHMAVVYAYMLWWSTNKMGVTDGDLAFWKEKYGYDEVKYCLTTSKIDLDALMGAIDGTPGIVSSSVTIGNVPISSIKGPYFNDAAAAAGGVALMGVYWLAAFNEYGEAPGALRLRVS